MLMQMRRAKNISKEYRPTFWPPPGISIWKKIISALNGF
jgi:hypothetical protein